MELAALIWHWNGTSLMNLPSQSANRSSQPVSSIRSVGRACQVGPLICIQTFHQVSQATLASGSTQSGQTLWALTKAEQSTGSVSSIGFWSGDPLRSAWMIFLCGPMWIPYGPMWDRWANVILQTLFWAIDFACKGLLQSLCFGKHLVWFFFAIDVSSTFVRNRLLSNRFVGALDLCASSCLGNQYVSQSIFVETSEFVANDACSNWY